MNFTRLQLYSKLLVIYPSLLNLLLKLIKALYLAEKQVCGSAGTIVGMAAKLLLLCVGCI
jgi:hypothetical protein